MRLYNSGFDIPVVYALPDGAGPFLRFVFGVVKVEERAMEFSCGVAVVAEEMELFLVVVGVVVVAVVKSGEVGAGVVGDPSDERILEIDILYNKHNRLETISRPAARGGKDLHYLWPCNLYTV